MNKLKLLFLVVCALGPLYRRALSAKPKWHTP